MPKQMTDKQLTANRRNAAKCTGPRTPEGKARSRWNALKHGLVATALIPPSLEPFEMPHTLESILTALREHFVPFGPVEGILVEIVAASYWRLARFYCAESGAAARASRIAELRRGRHAAEVAAVQRAIDELSREPGGPDPFAAELLARRQAELARLAAEDPEPELDRAALPGREDLITFGRHHAQITRDLHRAIFALERLQAARGFTPGRPTHEQGETGSHP
jgi:hypothetical protein